jgi:uncharacterized protein YcgI (DUF1989 family)
LAVTTSCSRRAAAKHFRSFTRTTNTIPSCFENLAANLSGFDIGPDSIPTTLNIFMNVEIEPNGGLKILPPRSKAGDAITLRAEMDMIVGLTACSAEMSNNYRFKQIGFEISNE